MSEKSRTKICDNVRRISMLTYSSASSRSCRELAEVIIEQKSDKIGIKAGKQLRIEIFHRGNFKADVLAEK